MAGYLFSLDSEDSLRDCIHNGVYSTKLSNPGRIWAIPHEGTFADYSSMKEGDSIYFFIKRKIYGIGSLININNQCKFLNYPNANSPINQNYPEIRDSLLLDVGSDESLNLRFICCFKPLPNFFSNGIDMDEILSSAPNQFKILRAFWKLSFIKFTEEENQAFKNILLRRNLDAIDNPNPENIFESQYIDFHSEIQRKTLNNDNYRLSIAPFLNTITNPNGSLRHEMAIEASLIYQLSNQHQPTIDIFGDWDYLSHQVIASPFKPIDYMDKMDVFGYKYIQNQKPTISHYLVIEMKKDVIDSQDIFQLMKYVDWIKNEYASGDYSMIKAFMVGFRYTDNALEAFREIIERKYIHGVRPSVAADWKDVKLITYSFNEEDNLLDFQIIADGNE
ncbi:MAG: hypothetical protein Q8R22_04420 [Flavobacterium sp.]|uniref:hypothetical protein n=1 Tax=Flavobacterium sp. TaxID=239 RepID=UPI002735673F|nr:hypothetical protein [Flavobacterium sp.]MDP3680057.1 hypothetical protein [Flavobacterium sp.]